MTPTAPKHAPEVWPHYKSPYGPAYHYQPQFHGITAKRVFGLGIKSAAFGGVALFTVIFYASGIPRLQRDVLQKVPLFGKYFINEIPPEDNPF